MFFFFVMFCLEFRFVAFLQVQNVVVDAICRKHYCYMDLLFKKEKNNNNKTPKRKKFELRMKKYEIFTKKRTLTKSNICYGSRSLVSLKLVLVYEFSVLFSFACLMRAKWKCIITPLQKCH